MFCVSFRRAYLETNVRGLGRGIIDIINVVRGVISV